MSASKQASAELAVVLPAIAFTRSGIAFHPREDVWAWTDGPYHVHMDFSRLNSQLIFMLEQLKQTLLVFAKGSSGHHLVNLFRAFNHFGALREDPEPFVGFTPVEVSNYHARLEKHEEWRLSTLNVLLQKWNALRLPGVDDECAQYLREKRKCGNEKGEAVRTRDPVEGPFSEQEYTALYKAVDAAYGMQKIPMWVAVLTRLLFACGGRISQYASLKVMDLREQNGSYVLLLPQVKTREEHSRKTLKEFDLSPQTGRLLQQSLFGRDGNEAMFPESLVLVRASQSIDRSPDDLFWGHCTGAQLSRMYQQAIEEIAPPTPRLDFEPLPIATKRFRYTFGTRLAEEGASKAVIADRLGHVDLQNVDVYFEASPTIVENIDRALDAQLAPLAQAFRGRLVNGEQDSTHKGAPGSRIIDFRAAKSPVGSCGGKGNGCAFNKPVACYTCFKFEPWVDAPHEKVLQRLLAERESCRDDPRLARINDDAILAVREVIAECAQAKEQREGGVK